MKRLIILLICIIFSVNFLFCQQKLVDEYFELTTIEELNVFMKDLSVSEILDLSEQILDHENYNPEAFDTIALAIYRFGLHHHWEKEKPDKQTILSLLNNEKYYIETRYAAVAGAIVAYCDKWNLTELTELYSSLVNSLITSSIDTVKCKDLKFMRYYYMDLINHADRILIDNLNSIEITNNPDSSDLKIICEKREELIHFLLEVYTNVIDDQHLLNRSLFFIENINYIQNQELDRQNPLNQSINSKTKQVFNDCKLSLKNIVVNKTNLNSMPSILRTLCYIDEVDFIGDDFYEELRNYMNDNEIYTVGDMSKKQFLNTVEHLLKNRIKEKE